MESIPIRDDPGGAVVPVHVVAAASRTEIVGVHGAHLRVRVAAPPDRGRANRAVERLLAEFFGAPVSLVAGATSRRKRFLVEGLDAATVGRRLGPG